MWPGCGWRASWSAVSPLALRAAASSGRGSRTGWPTSRSALADRARDLDLHGHAVDRGRQEVAGRGSGEVDLDAPAVAQARQPDAGHGGRAVQHLRGLVLRLPGLVPGMPHLARQVTN